MNSHLARLLLVALTCMLTACPIAQRMGWSSDGRIGLLACPDGLYSMNAEGKLGPLIVPKAESFAWMPDSRSIVATRKIKLKTWGEARVLLPESEVAQVERLVKALPHLIHAVVELTDKKGSVDDKLLKSYSLEFKGSFPDFDNLWIAACMASDRELLKAAANEPSPLITDSDFPSDLEISELLLVRLDDQGGTQGEPQVIERAVRPHGQPVVAPSGEYVACLRGKTPFVFHVASKSSWEVPDPEISGFAWSLDSRTLYTTVTPTGDKPGFSGLTSRPVAFKDGKWVSESPITQIGLILGLEGVPMRVLPNGRILFASCEFQLADKATAHECLYTFDPATTAITQIKAAGGLPTLGYGLPVSASGRYLALIQNETSIVAVLDMESGEVEQIASVEGWKNPIPPAWRGDVLYFATASGKDAAHPDLMRWSKGSPAQVVSQGWPDEVRDTLMTREDAGPEPEAK